MRPWGLLRGCGDYPSVATRLVRGFAPLPFTNLKVSPGPIRGSLSRDWRGPERISDRFLDEAPERPRAPVGLLGPRSGHVRFCRR